MRWDPAAVTKRSKLMSYLKLIRVEHTVFSLPFAYAGVFLVDPRPSPWLLLWVFLAVFGLRTAAMAYNNIADLELDRLNPRTRSRPLVVGAVSLRGAWLLVVLGSIVYYISAFILGPLPLLLSPIPWALALSYPYAKRLHPLPHLHLGLVLGLVVFGGAVAALSSLGYGVSNTLQALSKVPWVYVVAVTLWVAGFDIIYSIMDVDFDKRYGLHSIPAHLGVKGALLTALVMHVATSILLLLSIPIYHLNVIALAMTLAAIVLLALENILVWFSLNNIAKAFKLNLVVALLAGLAPVVGILV